MIFHLGTQWLTFMAILQGSESVLTNLEDLTCTFYKVGRSSMDISRILKI